MDQTMCRKCELFMLNIFLYDHFIVTDTHMESLSMAWWQLMCAENIYSTVLSAMENIHKASVKNSVNRYMETILPRTLTPDLAFLWLIIQ